jgi:hypothetical protein
MIKRFIPIFGLLLAVHLLPCIRSANAVVILDDGGSHVIDFMTDNVEVFNKTLFEPTHVDFLPGAVVGSGIFDNSLDVFDSSSANILGGTFAQDVTAFDNATINITGGTLEGDVHAFDFSTITISGGSIADDVEADDFAFVEIFGGSFGEDIEVFFHSTIDIYGGMLGVNGVFDSGLLAEHEAIITLFGSDFFVNGSPVGFGPIVPEFGTLSGILSDGSAFTMPFERLEDSDFISTGHILLSPVPEPASVILLILGIVAVTTRYRQRQPALK